MDLSTIKTKLDDGDYKDPWGVSLIPSYKFTNYKNVLFLRIILNALLRWRFGEVKF